MTAESSNGWHIVKAEKGQCQIVSAAEFAALQIDAATQTWGPFKSEGEAIARRVVLIRSGKCQPV
ncbi:MAG: hypothetical protein AAF728_12920 [Cyanobacteria bacterium P01_D01_bin.128]